jgi:hypothetical protein
MYRLAAVAVVAAALAGCMPVPRVTDITEGGVHIIAAPWTKDDEVRNMADNSCDIFGRKAEWYRADCVDPMCMTHDFIFHCEPVVQ